jgi:predicted transcriptional regulator
MKNITINSTVDQERRINIKNSNQKMKNLAIKGAGISNWEAQVLVDMIEEVYFSQLMQNELKPGQIKYNCISAEEGPGKPLKDCTILTVTLTLFDERDKGDFSTNNNKDRCLELRRRRLVRIVEEAKEQGGYLSQEDLSELLMCDIRTIRRDTKTLKDIGIILPTRGQQKDIGPGVTHRALAIRLWLEGLEPVAIANQIKHSIEAVENYLMKFKRVAYLKMKNFDLHEIAMTVGISCYATKTFLQIYDEFKSKTFFKQRLEEIGIVGAQYYQAQDEKKSTTQLNDCINREWR